MFSQERGTGEVPYSLLHHTTRHIKPGYFTLMTQLRWRLPHHSILRTPSSTILCEACKFWGPSVEGRNESDELVMEIALWPSWTSQATEPIGRVFVWTELIDLWWSGGNGGCGEGCLETRGFTGDLLHILPWPVSCLGEWKTATTHKEKERLDSPSGKEPWSCQNAGRGQGVCGMNGQWEKVLQWLTQASQESGESQQRFM